MTGSPIILSRKHAEKKISSAYLTIDNQSTGGYNTHVSQEIRRERKKEKETSVTEVNIQSGNGYIAVELWNDWTMSSIKGGKILKWRFASEKLIMKKKRGATAIAEWNSAANRRRIKSFPPPYSSSFLSFYGWIERRHTNYYLKRGRKETDALMIFWLRFFFGSRKNRNPKLYANKKIHHLSKSNVDIEPRHYTSALKDLTLPERNKKK